MSPRGGAQPAVPACIAVHARRARARAVLRGAFPRRRVRLVIAEDPEALAAVFRSELVDAAVVDLASASDETWRAAAMAREFPSAPFFGLLPLRAGDAPALARCAELEFADVLVEGVDQNALRLLLVANGYTTRFARALADPPPALGLATAVQQAAWRAIVAHGGRPVRTSELAHALGVTREHLSRTFAAGGAPNLKRVLDLVRIIAAAELAKNPGYDLRDVARVLGFASSSHMSSTAARVVGTRGTSLARLRTIDLLDRFTRGGSRSRA